MKPKGTKFKAGDGVGEVESVKTTSDVYCFVDGEITEVNAALAGLAFAPAPGNALSTTASVTVRDVAGTGPNGTINLNVANVAPTASNLTQTVAYAAAARSRKGRGSSGAHCATSSRPRHAYRSLRRHVRSAA